MTPHHCDHECVCRYHFTKDYASGIPCSDNCPHDTRSKTPVPAAPDAATIRNQTLEAFKDIEKMHIEGVSYQDLYNEFIQIYKSLRWMSSQEHRR